MDQPNPDTDMAARDEVLVRGLIDWVPLQRLHYHTVRAHPGEPIKTTQQRVMTLIHDLVQDDLAEIGDLNGPDDRFAKWSTSLNESLDRVRQIYIDRFDEDTIWPWYAWLNLTPKGAAVAEEIEPNFASE
ncbi:hypothetical protein ACRDU6_24690 [Mycolicibacterium sp. ELW1]|uniref:hypothetical protein n=1 Tax=Mycobacteriaceae TaxID=1762 RepID=UPI0011EE6B7F|nr:hypothetical protein [Mycobacterium sp. ELW1]QEN15456.1 hypothetical protein D3H54_21215 [Mycobacterium sp. ELW1]